MTLSYQTRHFPAQFIVFIARFAYIYRIFGNIGWDLAYFHHATMVDESPLAEESYPNRDEDRPFMKAGTGPDFVVAYLGANLRLICDMNCYSGPREDTASTCAILLV